MTSHRMIVAGLSKKSIENAASSGLVKNNFPLCRPTQEEGRTAHGA
jgi:hypothetical protein